MDQGHSPLGNPYVVRREEEREAACDAYEELLLLGPTVAAERPGRVAEVGTMNGFFGEVRGWDGEAAQRELGRLIERAAVERATQAALRLVERATAEHAATEHAAA